MAGVERKEGVAQAPGCGIYRFLSKESYSRESLILHKKLYSLQWGTSPVDHDLGRLTPTFAASSRGGEIPMMDVPGTKPKDHAIRFSGDGNARIVEFDPVNHVTVCLTGQS